MRLPIRVRMTAWYIALLAVVVVAVGAFLVVRLRADLTGAIDRTLRPATDQIAAGYHAEGAPEFRDSARTALAGERAAAQAVGGGGTVLVAVGDPVGRAPLLTRAQLAEVLARGSRLTGTVEPAGAAQSFRFAARPVMRHGRREAVVAAEALQPVERSVRRVLILLLLACPAALAATALGGWWLARRALRPVERIATTAGQIGVERLGERVAVPGADDELAHLARTLNTMLERIQRGVEEQRRLVADASHELRTPLAAMRSELDVSLRVDSLTPAARAVLESTREEVDRMARMVEDLLTLAAADEAALDLTVEAVDLRDVAADVVAALEPFAARRGVRVELRGDAAPVAGDPARLRHALRNLVENAIEFSPAAGAVEVAAWRSADEAGVTVRDDGPGIAPTLRERVFDRFFRVDASRTCDTGGTGLGLSIVREIAAAHGGRAWIDRPEGGGAAVTLALPRRASAGEPDERAGILTLDR